MDKYLQIETGHAITDLGKLYQTTCVKESLQNILPICIEFGIEYLDPQDKIISAIQLSVCEFESAGIDYPDTCKNVKTSVDSSVCIKELEQSSQFWTTFSGNYRELGHLCAEYSSPFAKDQMLQVYSNLTKFVADFTMKVQKTTNLTDWDYKFQDILQRAINNIELFEKSASANISEALQESIKLVESFQNEMNCAFENVSVNSKNMGVILDGTLANLGTVFHQISQISSEIDDLKFQDILQKMQNSWEISLNEVHDNSVEIIDKIVSNIENVEMATHENLAMIHNLEEPLKNNLNKVTEINQLTDQNLQLLEKQNSFLENEFSESIAIIAKKIEFETSFSFEQIKEKVSNNLNYINDQLDDVSIKIDKCEDSLTKLLNDVDSVVEVYYETKNYLSKNIIVQITLNLWGFLKQYLGISNILIWLALFASFKFLQICLKIVLNIK